MTMLELSNEILRLVRESGDENSVTVSVEFWQHQGAPKATLTYGCWVGGTVSFSPEDQETPEALLALVRSKFNPVIQDIEVSP